MVIAAVLFALGGGGLVIWWLYAAIKHSPLEETTQWNSFQRVMSRPKKPAPKQEITPPTK